MLLSPASSPSGATRALAVGASFALFAAAATTVSTSALLGTASAPASLNIATCSPILHSVAVDAGAQGLASIEDAGAPRVARSLAVVATGPTPTSFRPTASTFSAVLPPSAAASWAATWSMPTTAAASSLRHGQDLESRRRELGAAASEVTMNGAASVVAAAEGEPLRDEDDQQRMRERRWEGASASRCSCLLSLASRALGRKGWSSSTCDPLTTAYLQAGRHRRRPSGSPSAPPLFLSTLYCRRPLTVDGAARKRCQRRSRSTRHTASRLSLMAGLSLRLFTEAPRRSRSLGRRTSPSCAVLVVSFPASH